MGRIRELPPSVVNQIAAGEVVERPASVVKELLENAIDAGATRVELTVERGGRDLIRVADDGGGIDREDLPLAFRPHATSKLADATTCTGSAPWGSAARRWRRSPRFSRSAARPGRRTRRSAPSWPSTAASRPRSSDCGCPVGTVMEVRNLFFNTPVRRTFLKADSTEAGHVAETFTRIALAHPTVHLTYPLRRQGRSTTCPR